MPNSWYKARTEKTAVYANTHHRRQARIVSLSFDNRMGMGVGNVHATAQVAAGNCLDRKCTRVWGGPTGASPCRLTQVLVVNSTEKDTARETTQHLGVCRLAQKF